MSTRHARSSPLAAHSLRIHRPFTHFIHSGRLFGRYVTLYTKDELQLVPQEQPWGFTEQAEVVNGRLAMLAITLSVGLTFDPTLKLLVA